MRTLGWKTTRAWIASAAIAALSALAHAQSDAPAAHPISSGIDGMWVLDGGKITIRIAACDAGAASLCGTVIRAQAASAKDGAEVKGDSESSAMIGWKLLRDFSPSDNGEWKGQMANFEDKKLYSCVMRLESSERLWVRPYVGIVALGKTHMWTRIKEMKGLPAMGSVAH